MDDASQSDREFKTYRELLSVKPEKWGLRGDPCLWGMLYEGLGDKMIPTTYPDFLKDILDTVYDLSGYDLTLGQEPIHDQRFASGSGMSDGTISPSWWLNTCLPVLWDRVRG